jgi:hypothetical protein
MNLERRRDEDERAIASRFYRGRITSADESLFNYLTIGLEDICRRLSESTNYLTPADITDKKTWLTKAVDLTAKVLMMSPQCRLEYVTNHMSDCEPPNEASMVALSEGKTNGQKAYVFITITNRMKMAIPVITAKTNSEQPAHTGTASSNKDLPNEKYQLLAGMSIALNAKYCLDFAGLFSLEYVFHAEGPKSLVVIAHFVTYSNDTDPTSSWLSRSILKGQPQTNGESRFISALTKWTNSAYADSIDPQMYA